MKMIWACDRKFGGKDAFEIADLVRIERFPHVMSRIRTVLEGRELLWARKDVVEQ